MARLTFITLLLLPVGCANLKPGQLPSRSEKVESSSQSQIELQVALAHSAEQRGDTDKALATYENLISKGHATAGIHHRIALLQDAQGNSKVAQKHYAASLELKPNQAEVLCDYGYSLYLSESFELAETQYTHAIEADPQNVRARANYGLLLARTQRYDEALHQFANGGLSEAEAHHNIAMAAAENGDSQTAVTAINLSREADGEGKASGNRQALQQVVYRMAERQAR